MIPRSRHFEIPPQAYALFEVAIARHLIVLDRAGAAWAVVRAYAKLSQKQKFIAAAKAGEADETGETFTRAFGKIAARKTRPAR